MDWVSGWIQGIIVAVIISTIIEMILPEGTSKKYIKVVVGIYILFSIVSPVISKVTGNSFKVSNIFDLDEYIEASKNSGSMPNTLESQNEEQVKSIYTSSIKGDIKEKTQAKGYIVNNIEVEVENDEQYTLKKINLQLSKKDKKTEDEEDTSNVVENNDNIINNVNEVKIDSVKIKDDEKLNSTSNSETDTSNKKDNISGKDKKELKEYLSSVYEINVKNIFINE